MFHNMQTCILSFNHPQHTSRCVRSTLPFLQPENLHLIHNGSRAENITQLKNEFPQIHHHTLEINKGFTGGANFALQTLFTTTNTDWVFFVTNDCELLSTPTPPPKPGLFAPLIYRRKLTQIDSIGAVFYPLKGKLEHIRETPRALSELTHRSHLKHWQTRYFYVPGTAFYIHRETHQALQGFDESLHTYWEDVDLSARARQQSLTLGIHPTTQLLHKVGKTCHKDPFYTNVLFKKNRRTISQRYTPRWLHPLQNLIF